MATRNISLSPEKAKANMRSAVVRHKDSLLPILKSTQTTFDRITAGLDENFNKTALDDGVMVERLLQIADQIAEKSAATEKLDAAVDKLASADLAAEGNFASDLLNIFEEQVTAGQKIRELLRTPNAVTARQTGQVILSHPLITSETKEKIAAIFRASLEKKRQAKEIDVRASNSLKRTKDSTENMSKALKILDGAFEKEENARETIKTASLNVDRDLVSLITTPDTGTKRQIVSHLKNRVEEIPKAANDIHDAIQTARKTEATLPAAWGATRLHIIEMVEQDENAGAVRLAEGIGYLYVLEMFRRYALIGTLIESLGLRQSAGFTAAQLLENSTALDTKITDRLSVAKTSSQNIIQVN